MTGAIHNSAGSLVSSVSKLIKAMADYPIEERAAILAVRGFQDASAYWPTVLALGYDVVGYYHYHLLVVLLAVGFHCATI
jgi:hypothetical protein